MQMENRIKKLKDEDQKIKNKIKQTKEKTKVMVTTKQKRDRESQFIDQYKKEMEKSLQEKRERIQKSRE